MWGPEVHSRDSLDECPDLPNTLCDAPGLLCLLGPDGQFRRLSSAWRETFGIEEKELIGRRWVDCLHPDDRERGAEVFGRPEARRLRFEGRFVCQGGAARWLSWEARRVAEGCWLCVAHDLTEQRRVERRLSKQLLVARVLARASGASAAEPRLLEALCESEGWQAGGLWWVDAEKAVMRCAATWHVPGLDVEELEEASRRIAFQRGSGLPGVVWATGAPAWIENTDRDDRFPRAPIAARCGLYGACAFPVMSGDEVIGVIELFSSEATRPDDLTVEMMETIGAQVGQLFERRRAEEALRRTTRRLEHVVGGGTLLVLVADTDGRVVLHEGGALGPHTNLLGKSLPELFSDPAHELPRSLARALAGETLTRIIDLGGASYDARFGPLHGERGDISGVIVVATDVTRQRDAERRLDLSQVRLVEADRLAALGTLAAGIAHEINNPLTYVNINLGRLTSLELSLRSRDPLSLHRSELLQNTREGLARVAQIVHELRTFSRVDEEPAAPIDVRPLIDSAIRLADHEIRHRARLVRDYAEVPPVLAGAGRLGQVFVNILVNAAQAIPEGEAHLNEIRVSTYRDERGRVVVEVKDTGAGIAPEQLGKIFDPFYTTKPRGSGTGLGLSICHGIVVGLGGEITAESILGRGTTLRVVLPPAAEVEVSERPRERMLTPPPREAGAEPRGRLLIIDDDRSVAASMAMVLGDAHEVAIAGSGREALQILNTDSAFDVVICDLMMPEISGMDVYEAVRLTQRDLAQRFIFMTGGATTTMARRFVAETEFPVIEKPFSPDHLRRLVGRQVARWREATPARPEPPGPAQPRAH